MKLLKTLEDVFSAGNGKEYSYNTFWLISEKVIRLLLSFLVSVWLIRYLGPERFGIYSYVLSILIVLQTIAKLGLDDILVREMNYRKKTTVTLVGSAFWLKMIPSALFVMVSIILYLINGGSSELYYLVMIASASLLFLCFDVVEFFCLAEVRAKIVSICKVAQLILSSLVKVYLIISQAPIEYFILVVVFDFSLLALLYVVYYRRTVGQFPFAKFDADIARDLLKDGWPLIITALFTIVYSRTDQFMIMNMLDEYELGLYSAAMRLADIWLAVPAAICTSLAPAILSARRESMAEFEKRMVGLYKTVLLLGVCVCIVTYIISEYIVFYVLGLQYQASESVLIIKIFETLFVALGLARVQWVVANNFQRDALWVIISGAIVNVVMNYFLIPLYGIEGAAIASLISIILVVMVIPIFFKRMRRSIILMAKSFSSFR